MNRCTLALRSVEFKTQHHIKILKALVYSCDDKKYNVYQL